MSLPSWKKEQQSGEAAFQSADNLRKILFWTMEKKMSFGGNECDCEDPVPAGYPVTFVSRKVF